MKLFNDNIVLQVIIYIGRYMLAHMCIYIWDQERGDIDMNRLDR